MLLLNDNEFISHLSYELLILVLNHKDNHHPIIHYILQILFHEVVDHKYEIYILNLVFYYYLSMKFFKQHHLIHLMLLLPHRLPQNNQLLKWLPISLFMNINRGLQLHMLILEEGDLCNKLNQI